MGPSQSPQTYEDSPLAYVHARVTTLASKKLQSSSKSQDAGPGLRAWKKSRNLFLVVGPGGGMVQWTGHWLSPQRDLGGNKIALIG